MSYPDINANYSQITNLKSCHNLNAVHVSGKNGMADCIRQEIMSKYPPEQLANVLVILPSSRLANDLKHAFINLAHKEVSILTPKILSISQLKSYPPFLLGLLQSLTNNQMNLLPSLNKLTLYHFLRQSLVAFKDETIHHDHNLVSSRVIGIIDDTLEVLSELNASDLTIQDIINEIEQYSFDDIPERYLKYAQILKDALNAYAEWIQTSNLIDAASQRNLIYSHIPHFVQNVNTDVYFCGFDSSDFRNERLFKSLAELSNCKMLNFVPQNACDGISVFRYPTKQSQIDLICQKAAEFSENNLKVGIVCDNNASETAIKIINTLKESDIYCETVFGKNIKSLKIYHFFKDIILLWHENFRPVRFLGILKNSLLNKDIATPDIVGLLDTLIRNGRNVNLRYSNLSLTPSQALGDFIRKIQTFYASTPECNNILATLTRVQTAFKLLEKPQSTFLSLLKAHVDIFNNLCQIDETDPYYQKFHTFTQELIGSPQSIPQINISGIDEYIKILETLALSWKFPEDSTKLSNISVLNFNESRLLTFDVLILPNFTESLITGSTRHNYFLPQKLKEKLKLPTHKDHNKNLVDNLCTLIAGSTKVLAFASQDMTPSSILNIATNRYNIPIIQTEVLPNDNQVKKHRYSQFTCNILSTPATLFASKLGDLNQNPAVFCIKNVLNLKILDPIERTTHPADYGTAIHAAANNLAISMQSSQKDKSALYNAFVKDIHEVFLLKNENTHYLKIKEYLIDDAFENLYEDIRLQLSKGYKLYPEILGTACLQYFNKNVTFVALIDRLDASANSFNVINYKSGLIPTGNEVKAFKEPQILIEYLVAKLGIFADLDEPSLIDKHNGLGHLSDLDSDNSTHNNLREVTAKLWSLKDNKTLYLDQLNLTEGQIKTLLGELISPFLTDQPRVFQWNSDAKYGKDYRHFFRWFNY